MLALLTGAPGVGKTTVARLLAESQEGIVCRLVGFGQELYKEVSARRPEISYAEFRADASQLVSDGDMLAVANRISEQARLVPENEWLIVDSHAVSFESAGWHANPDTPEQLKSYGYDVIVALLAQPSVIIDRLDSRGHEGRRGQSVSALELLASVQTSIATYYAGILGCPLWIIDANPAPSEVTSRVIEILRRHPTRGQQ